MKRMAKSITDDYTAEAGQLLAIYGADHANPQPLADWIHANATDSETGVMVGRDGELIATLRLEFDGEDENWRVEEAIDPRAAGAAGKLAADSLRELRGIFGRPMILATVRDFTADREPEAE